MQVSSNLSFAPSPVSTSYCYAAWGSGSLVGRRKYGHLFRPQGSARRHPCTRASADSTESQHNLNLRESLPTNRLKPDIVTDKAAATAQALLDDLADRPEYYLNISGVLLGLALSCVVLSATVVALDSIPFVPDGLRVIGLAYLFWFLNKFLFSAAERERLGDAISEFVSGVRGADIAKVEQVEDA